MQKLICLLSIVLLLVSTSFHANKPKPIHVKIVQEKGAFKLLKDGKPYFIKGAVGKDYMEKLKKYGGNSVRIGSRQPKEILDKAQSLGLTALVNLPVRAQRDGMDYDNEQAVKEQHEQVIEMVKQFKDHPAVLMWALGNELDFIQANVKEKYNTKVWDAVNALAKEIHQLDPNHPIMTVVGSIDQEKIGDLLRQCPDLDLLGINEYGDLNEIPKWLREFGWKKPYVVTEWGPTGFWQVPKTAWKVPIEETSSMKADKYKERYEQSILADKEMCLGSYVFLWRQHQERTHTWFGMFDENGLETEAVDVMHYVWSGKWPKNRAPQLQELTIEGKKAYDNVYLQEGKAYTATVKALDPEKDGLRYSWEVLPEGKKFPYGGNGEKKPDAIQGLIAEADKPVIQFNAPAEAGSYRLFVYVYDDNGHFATANVPFYVNKEGE